MNNRKHRTFTVEVGGRYDEWILGDNEDGMGSTISECVWLIGTGKEKGKKLKKRQ
ncbi:hypothetical protein Mpt1_c08600 [Candidatus Methanoplasma termitum]|uniref:Uncharacterized protein n=1 Tax=Candidatus Methanoplasma termitum TaxID=1577791 RepID=A0A0A7LGV7_9ARCH|nr:hypothetical protein Mpt1_c08600 [Candidatus Methanoplasma termitum]